MCAQNPVSFGGQPIGSEEFLNRMVEALEEIRA